MLKNNLNDLLARIQALQEDVEEEYRKAREDLQTKQAELAEEFLRQQKRYKIGLFRFLARSNLLDIITAPIIYSGWIPFLLMDLFVTVYQTICFPVYRIPKVTRSDYLVFDRGDLPYLNLIEKFNCFYCSYGNGVAAYTREARLRSAWGVARRLDEILRMKPAGDRVVTMPAELGELVLPPMGGALSPGAAAATAASPASR